MKIYKYFFAGTEIKKDEYKVKTIFKEDMSIIDEHGATYTKRLKILQFFCPPIRLLYLPYKLSESQIKKINNCLNFRFFV